MQVLDWGLIDYRLALEKQEQLLDEIAANKKRGVLVFCSHPEVVTLGRKTQAGDVFDFQGPIYEIARGGRATYHGPSQLVIYPIVNLELAPPRNHHRDIGWYLRSLEDAIVEVLKIHGIQAVGKSLQKRATSESETEETGVWVNSRKIASLGIGVRKWVTYHGAALNLEMDPGAFRGLKPCGFTTQTMVSVEEFLGAAPDRAQWQAELTTALLQKFSSHN